MPLIDGFLSGLASGLGARVTSRSEREDARSAVGWVGTAFDVAGSDESVGQLGAGLLGDAEVGGEVSCGGVARGDAGECEPMQRDAS